MVADTEVTQSIPGSSELRTSRTGRPVQLKEALWPTLDGIEQVARGIRPTIGLSTGYADVDALISSFRAGELVLLAGRPAMGKTAFALDLARSVAIDQAVPVLLLTLETMKDEIIQRILCAEARIDSSRLRKGLLRDEDFTRLARAAGIVSSSPIWIDDEPDHSFERVIETIRQFSRTHDVQLVLIDYFQLLEGPMPHAENRTQELAAMSRGLKALAKELRTCIVVTAQCSRAPDQRAAWNRRPFLTDVRDSGAIEEDADVVMFLYREEFYSGPVDSDGNSVEGKAEIIVAKNRTGPIGIAPLFFHKHCARFDSHKERAS